jgi:acetyltransferase-like isoleucine patch superfamily enzyme
LGNNRRRPEIVRQPVIIEDDVWVGPNATVLKGVRIGSGAVIEAGSLVVHDVPALSRVAGNPARVVEVRPA